MVDIKDKYIGKALAITFLDHAEDSGKPLEFTVFGRLAKVAKEYVVVDSWAYTDRRAYDDNVKRFTIVRSAITEAQLLKVDKWL